jgi:hypothetical protein
LEGIGRERSLAITGARAWGVGVAEVIVMRFSRAGVDHGGEGQEEGGEGELHGR